jgi:hypothetical protein
VCDAITRQQLAAAGVFVSRRLAAAQRELLDFRAKVGDQRFERRGVSAKVVRARIQLLFNDWHGSISPEIVQFVSRIGANRDALRKGDNQRSIKLSTRTGLRCRDYPYERVTNKAVAAFCTCLPGTTHPMLPANRSANRCRSNASTTKSTNARVFAGNNVRVE